jgi:hypothetical protein
VWTAWLSESLGQWQNKHDQRGRLCGSGSIMMTEFSRSAPGTEYELSEILPFGSAQEPQSKTEWGPAWGRVPESRDV